MTTKNKSTISQKQRIIDVFSALGDKTRYKLLSILSKEEQICVSELASQVGISNAGVSQQLKILEQAGLVARNRNGQKICYTVKNKDSLNKQLLSLMASEK